MTRRVNVVRGAEEWDGLYIDRRLVYEDHSLDAFTVLDRLAEAGVITIGDTIDVTMESIERNGARLWRDLAEVPDDARL